MAIIQSLNSKANVKKITSNDVPYSTVQPVLGVYGPVESTASQTIINLPFSIDTVNNPDALVLWVNGQKMARGSSYDFTFTAIAADGTSSQVTLNSALVAGINIEAHKLGLKKESEFQTDNRFTSMYAAMDAGFQGFVDEQTNRLTAINGTPSATQFRSSITGRASITDISQDLKPRMGVERIQVQQIYELQNEFGPNGERVFAALNDDRGLMRFVGGWGNFNDTNGARPISTATSTTDFVEITFYGTGLNIIGYTTGTRDWRATVDGGAEGANFIPVMSSVLTGRYYAAHPVLPVVSGLILGIHTVKIRSASGSQPLEVQGFEILNESSLVKTTPGIACIKGQKYQSTSLQSHSYSSAVTGTKGGRVVEYLTSAGIVGQAWQAVDSSPAYLTSADHSNEEVIRTYAPSEFGAGRSDDFSNSGSATRAFTLNDGTTTLILNSGSMSNQNKYWGVSVGGSSFLVITFVGTGLDILRDNGGTSQSLTVTIDGTSPGSLTALPTGPVSRVDKVCSGLPYGTHMVKLALGAGAYNETIAQFIVYGPKKPSIPSGAIELADYNVMANYVANSTASLDTIATGVLRKELSIIEGTYVNGTGGTTDWTIQAISPSSQIGGYQIQSNRQNAYAEYTFFGTGFELRFTAASSRSANISVTLNGLAATTANYPSLVSSVYGTGVTFVSGVLDQNDASATSGSGLSISGLPAGKYTVRFNNNTAGSVINLDCFDIITPIHSHKSSLYADLQNFLPIGSCAISDNRKITPVRDTLPAQKAWAQAVGVANNPTTSSTSLVPMPDMSVTIKTSGSPVEIAFTGVLYNGTAGNNSIVNAFVNGSAVGITTQITSATINQLCEASLNMIVALPVGTHKIDIYWQSPSGTSVTSNGTHRILKVKEL